MHYFSLINKDQSSQNFEILHYPQLQHLKTPIVELSDSEIETNPLIYEHIKTNYVT